VFTHRARLDREAVPLQGGTELSVACGLLGSIQTTSTPAGVKKSTSLPVVLQQLLNAGIRSAEIVDESFSEKLEHLGRMKAQSL
jgi:hypothetical protein